MTVMCTCICALSDTFSPTIRDNKNKHLFLIPFNNSVH